MEQNNLNESEASALIEDPRFGLDSAWRTPAVTRALLCSGAFEDAPFLASAIRGFMSARATSAQTDRLIKLWTSLNALRNHVTARFEVAQAQRLRLKQEKLPRRYRIQTMDYLSLSAFAELVDPAKMPNFGTLRSPAYRDAQRLLGDMAEGLERECKQNPRGVLAQLTEPPGVSAPSEASTCGIKSSTATERLFDLTNGLGTSPLVFVMLVAAYELRNGLIHGTIAQPLLPNEERGDLAALGLCCLVLDSFLDRTLPQVMQQLDAGDDGHMAPFAETYRQAIAHYLDHRFDGGGIFAMLRKYGLIW